MTDTTLATTTPKVIHANVYDPSGFNLFKPEANARAKCSTIVCVNLECPLLARGQCWMRGGLFGNKCPYGQSRTDTGPTKRAAGLSSWVRDAKEKTKGVPWLDAPPKRMEFIGDFVLLPYSHMDMCEAVPFRRHSQFIISGDPFIPRAAWSLETVLTLVAFRPRAMMGGEITSYRIEEVPLFLTHLREVDPAMWSQLVAARPELDVSPNHVGRKALLRTLKSPLTWTESANDKYPVTWTWDGKTLATTSMNSYSSTWGRVKVDSVVIHATPAKDATVIVQSNEWVVPTTEFAN